MEKRISYEMFQSVKRVAQACNPQISKCDGIKKKIQKLEEEYALYDMQIQALEAGIKNATGFRVSELVKKVIEPGVDANGKPKKTTKYLPTDIVKYDNEKRQYVVTIPDRVPQESVPSIEEVKVVAQVEPEHEETIEAPASTEGSDFDIDKDPFGDVEPVENDIF